MTFCIYLTVLYGNTIFNSKTNMLLNFLIYSNCLTSWFFYLTVSQIICEKRTVCFLPFQSSKLPLLIHIPLARTSCYTLNYIVGVGINGLFPGFYQQLL